jgi:hypothetical protein
MSRCNNEDDKTKRWHGQTWNYSIEDGDKFQSFPILPKATRRSWAMSLVGATAHIVQVQGGRAKVTDTLRSGNYISQYVLER